MDAKIQLVNTLLSDNHIVKVLANIVVGYLQCDDFEYDKY